MPFFLFNSGITRLSVLLQTLITFIDPKPVRIRGLRFLHDGAALRSKRWHGKRDYNVYVINRKRDSDRLARFSRTCARWRIPYSRVDGVDLQQNPDLLLQYSNRIAEYCYNQKNFVKGIYGCFLGHREAWLRFQDSGDDWALICEDDARFLGPIPRCIQDFCIPPGTELVFVNQRMATGLLHHEQHVKRPSPLFDLVPTRTAVQALLAMDPHIDSPGGDGYLLSKHGVDKLLHAFEHSQMAFDVDWFMLFQCLD
ncbi:MAG: glycosyltransferase family 25 protein, partial [Pirellulaceae bacterium]